MQAIEKSRRGLAWIIIKDEKVAQDEEIEEGEIREDAAEKKEMALVTDGYTESQSVLL